MEAMYVALSQIMTPLLSPLGFCAAIWAVALFLHLRRQKKRSRCFAVTGIFVLLLFSNPIISSTLLGELEDDFESRTPAEYPKTDAIVVLGGITAPPKGSRVSVHVGTGFDRLLHGMRLLRAKKAHVLVLSGGIVGGGMSEAEQMQRLAIEYGIVPTALLLEANSRNTRENAVNSTSLLNAMGLKRIILVTSGSHMRRAAAAFIHVGADVIPAPTDIEIVPKRWAFTRLVPTVQALQYSSRAIKEYVGYAVYWLRGWV